MILIDHLGVGTLNSYIVFKRITKKLILFGIVFSVLCDIDVLWSGSPGSISYIKYHRVWSHSLVVVIPLILIVTLALKKLNLKILDDITFRELVLIQVLGYTTHLTLDLFTPYGVPLFYPLTSSRYSIDLLHDLDPITSFISIILIVSIYLHKKKGISRYFILIIAGSYIFYITAVFIIKENTEQILREKFSVSKETEIKMIPKTFWRWKGIVEKENEIVVLSTSIRPDTFPTLNSSAIKSAIQKNETLKIFKEYARIPAIEKINDSTYNFYNLAYSTENYKLTVVFDKNYNLKSYETTSFDLIDK